MSLPITFLSDYGYADEFAGVCRAVIARIAPAAPLIDLTHGIRRHEVGHGAAALAAALPFAAPGVHLAVVDPGVGAQRRAVAVRAADDGRLLVGPDNGLLWPAAQRLGGAVEAVEISRSPVRIEPTSQTFHGRDLFAPVAAHLAIGAALADLGDPVDPGSLVALERPPPRVVPGGGIVATVGHRDGYGNVVLVAGAADLATAGLEPGARITVGAAGREHRAIHGRTFADAPAGGLLAYEDSSGALALAVNRGDAAALLGIGAGDEVELRPA